MSTIAERLGSLGLSEYEPRFAENDIDVSVLPHLTEQHLKDLGISLGHRLKMPAAMRQQAIQHQEEMKRQQLQQQHQLQGQQPPERQQVQQAHPPAPPRQPPQSQKPRCGAPGLPPCPH